MGKNPQTEEMLDNWHCAVAILPMLLVENAQVSRGTTVALEGLRNGVISGIASAVQRRMIDADGDYRS